MSVPCVEKSESIIPSSPSYARRTRETSRTCAKFPSALRGAIARSISPQKAPSIMHHGPDFGEVIRNKPHPNPRRRVKIAKTPSETLPVLHLLACHASLSYHPPCCNTLAQEPRYGEFHLLQFAEFCELCTYQYITLTF